MTAFSVHQIDSHDPMSTRESFEGGGNSESRSIVDLHDSSVRLGSWIAEPGTYASAGVPLGEWFIVIEGKGVLMLEGQDPIELGPGTVVHTEAGLPSRLRVEEKLSKVSLIGL